MSEAEELLILRIWDVEFSTRLDGNCCGCLVAVAYAILLKKLSKKGKRHRVLTPYTLGEAILGANLGA